MSQSSADEEIHKNIPKDCIPPKQYWPDFMYNLPELKCLPSQVNLGDYLLDRRAEKNPSKVAIYYEDRKILYGELQKASNRLARSFGDLGIEDNDRIVLHMPNIPEFLTSLFACWKIGAIPTLINHLLKPEDIAFRMNDTEAKLAITHESCYRQLSSALTKCKHLREVIAVGKHLKNHLDFRDLTQTGGSKLCLPKFSLDHFARLIFTSGATGQPKGALTTYRQTIATCLTYGGKVLKITENDVLGGNPFFTLGFGSTNFTIYPWFFDAAISILEHFDPATVLEIVENHKMTILCETPTGFRKMLASGVKRADYDLESLRLSQSSGEWLPPYVIKEWREKFGVPIMDSLGANEVFYFCSAYENMPQNKWGSTGLPVPGYEIRIVDNSFEDVAACTPGLMIMKGPTGILYWRRPDEQKKAVRQGWNVTELICKCDRDGHLWFLSRRDDMIVSGSYKISPIEIEIILEKHPLVSKCAVLQMEDAIKGHVPRALVVLKDENCATKECANALKEYAEEKLEPYKCPKEIEFVKEIPRTEEGKVKRYLLGKNKREYV